MNEFIISELRKLQKGEQILFTKDTDPELSKIISQLKNLNVLKQEKFRISLKNSKHLSKIIEFKSIDKYLNWVNDKNSITELNKEQSKKADHILELVCNSDNGIKPKIAYDLFESESETLEVLSILEKYNLIKLWENQNGDITSIDWTINTCHFFREGGFLKKYNEENKKPEKKEIKEEPTNSIKEKLWNSKNIWWQIIIPIIVGIILLLLAKII